MSINKTSAADKLRKMFENTTSAQMEDYAFEVPNSDGEDTYATMLVAVSLDFFHRDHPKGQVRREVIYNEPGRAAGVRCMLYNNDGVFICDGFGEAVSGGVESLPLNIASNRALKDALRTAGYGVPSWVLLEAATEKLIGDDGESSVIGEALEAAAEVLGEEPKKTSEAKTEKVEPAVDDKPRKRRGRKPKNASVAPAAEVFEPEDVPDAESEQPKQAESEQPVNVAVPDTSDIPPVDEPLDTSDAQSLWNSIPETGNTVEDLKKYLPGITENEIRDVRMPFGHNMNRTIGELAGTANGRKILRQYCDSARLKGSKVWVALLKACEIYGM